MNDPAAGISGATSASGSYLTFRSNGRLYALPGDEVSEVMRVPAVARIPQGPPALLGLANLRGAVLPVVSLGVLLGMGGKVQAAASRVIVLDVGAPVALVVDAVESLVDVAQDRIETRPSALGAEAGERLTGGFRTSAEGDVARILDIKPLLDAAFEQRARPGRQTLPLTGAGAAMPRTNESAAGQSMMMVTFDVAGQEFALDLREVQEIVPAPDSLTTVPRSDAPVLGVTSLRETLLPLLSLRALLGFPPAPSSDVREKVLVTNVGGARVGLVADRARAIVSAEPSLVDPVPAVLAARTGGEARIKAIYRGDGGRRLISILAPQQLFRDDVMQRLGTDRDAPDSQGPQAGVDRRGELQFLVFRLGKDEFGLPIEAVDEVAQVPAQITRVPKTPKFLEGVVNLRGEVLPVVDQRRRFDMPPLEDPQGRRLLVVRSERHRAALIVDSVSDVLRVPADRIEPAPELTDETARLVRGVLNLAETARIVLVLDPAELLTRAERGLLDAFRKSGQGDA